MSCSDELLRIARRLKKQGYFSGWDIKALQAYIRDKGHCVYCGEPLLDAYGVASAGDHLLPKKCYEGLDIVQNIVASCGECNALKRNYDPFRRSDTCSEPSADGEPDLMNDAVRSELIKNATAEIKKRRAAGNWRVEFQVAKPQFDEAVEAYQRCLQSESTGT